jgi:KaiC domain protein
MSEDDTADGDDDWFERAVSGADDEVPSDTRESEDPDASTGPGDDPDWEKGEPVGASEGIADEGGSPFEEEGGKLFEDEEGDSPFEDDGGDSPFEDEEGDSPFHDDGGELFEDDFASAFGGAGGEDFDEEDFESAIPRIDLGIEGLDNMIQGGVPERHLIVAIGSAGTGKTTVGLQFLQHGLAQGDNCVFITLEQSQESIIDTAAEYGWEFPTHLADDRLAVIDIDPIEMANSLDNIRGELPRLIEDFEADRFVLDSVSLLEMMYDNQARRRTEVYDFSRSLKRAGVTTLLTSEADEDNPYASRHGIIEYLTDAVFVLQYVRGETRETRLAVEIQKIRNGHHSRETKPYEITDQGISVYEQANIF